MRAASRTCLALILSVLPVITLPAANIAVVIQKARAFSVPTMHLLRGESIRFTNDDVFLHQVYIETPSFTYESDEQEPGTSIDVQFPKSGLFEVHCHIHPKMLLQVEVH